MDGKLNNEKVTCCFCGKSVLICEAIIINVGLNINSKESQTLFAHKKHLMNVLYKKNILYIDNDKEDD